MSRYSRILGALFGLAALPLFLACEDDPISPSRGRLPEQQTIAMRVVPEWARIEVGETVQLRGLLPGTQRYGKIEWETSDPTIALVNDGEVLGRAPGEATITATWDGHRGMARVAVQDGERIAPEDNEKFR
jgi:hypothetical protein